MQKRAFLLDVGYVMARGSKGAKSKIRLLVKDVESGKTYRVYDEGFEPYFYVKLSPENEKEAEKAKEELAKVRARNRGEELKINRTQWEEKMLLGKMTKLVKVVAFHPGDVSTLREEAKRFGETFEHEISFTKRYVIDKQVIPNEVIEFELNEDKTVTGVKAGKRAAGEILKFKAAGLDIETYNPQGVPRPERDPAVMVGVADEKEKKLFTFGKEIPYEGVGHFAGEKEMLEETGLYLKREKIDVLYTYNGDVFDLPYMKDRAKKTGAAMHLGRDRSLPKTKQLGLRMQSSINGRIHFDVYPVVSLMNFIGAYKLERLTLKVAYKEILGGKKEDLERNDIWKIWDEGTEEEMKNLYKYCMVDAQAALDLGERMLPLEVELSKISGGTLFDTTRSTPGQLVEMPLMRESFRSNEMILSKPKFSEVQARQENPVEGAFVKLPSPGLYENIAVLDFRSLYPSIIISHNIDPSTLNCTDCKPEESFISPKGHRFCKKRKGLIPRVLEYVLGTRVKLKEEMKALKKDGKEQSVEYKEKDAQQWSLKILANSTYGYLLYARSRYYSRECGESVTAYARDYIQDTMQKAEKLGLKVLYGDSITADRFVTLLDPQGSARVKNIEELFEENKKDAFRRGEKDAIQLKGWKALSMGADGKSCWKPVLEVIRHRNGKKVFKVLQKYGETRVTEDHSLMVWENGKLMEAKPQEMVSKPMIKIEEIPEVTEIRRLDLYEILKPYSKKIAYKGREKQAQVHADERSVWFGWENRAVPVKLKRFIEVESREFESLCRLLGAYISEGSSSTAETTNSRLGASIANTDNEWLNQLQGDYLLLFENVKAGIIPSMKGERELTYPTSGFAFKTINYFDSTHKLQMMNGLAAVFFKMLAGQKSSGKKIPSFIFHAPEKYKRILLDNMVKGDGSHSTNTRLNYSEHYKKTNFKYTTNSLELASGLTLLLSQLGIRHYVGNRPSKKAYTIGTSFKNNAAFTTKLSEESYEGFVYDLSVEGTHTFVDSCGQVLLHNTDSIFIHYPKGEEKKVDDFQKHVNKDLPESMELELEDIYPRGIFVGKKQAAEKGAKKKYALINREGKIKIRGFELVRRDWSGVAKETQREVLRILLVEGNVDKAVEIVKKVVDELKTGNVPLERLAITTQLKKKSASYEIVSPEVSAFLKAKKSGMQLDEHSVVSYVITRTGKSISDKATLIEMAKDYDADYYINNQVMPAVLKILGSLGYGEDDIKLKGKQKSMADW